MARIMRKVRTGAVVRTNQDKTAIVEMIWKQRHRLYRKQMRRVARFYVHDPENQCRLGDTVRIEETRPISKNKHWRLIEILERKQIAEVRPIDVETDVAPEMTQPRVLAAEARAEAANAEADEHDSEDQVESAEEQPAEDDSGDQEEPVEDESPEEEAADDETEDEADSKEENSADDDSPDPEESVEEDSAEEGSAEDDSDAADNAGDDQAEDQEEKE